MSDINMLKKKIDESGMSIIAIAEKSGMVRATLYNRLKGVSEFKASEITNLSNTLHLTAGERNKIFFAQKVEAKETPKKKM